MSYHTEKEERDYKVGGGVERIKGAGNFHQLVLPASSSCVRTMVEPKEPNNSQG